MVKLNLKTQDLLITGPNGEQIKIERMIGGSARFRVIAPKNYKIQRVDRPDKNSLPGRAGTQRVGIWPTPMDVDFDHGATEYGHGPTRKPA